MCVCVCVCVSFNLFNMNGFDFVCYSCICFPSWYVSTFSLQTHQYFYFLVLFIIYNACH